MSTPFRRSTRARAAASTFWRSATSSGSTTAVPPKAWISAATSSSVSRRLPMRATVAPSRANIRAPALPIPVPAPVIQTTLPANALISLLLVLCGISLAAEHAVNQELERGIIISAPQSLTAGTLSTDSQGFRAERGAHGLRLLHAERQPLPEQRAHAEPARRRHHGGGALRGGAPHALRVDRRASFQLARGAVLP